MVDRDRTKAKADAIAAIREHGNGAVDAVLRLLDLRAEELKDEMVEDLVKGQDGQAKAGAVAELQSLSATLSRRAISGQQKSGAYAGQHTSEKRPRD